MIHRRRSDAGDAAASVATNPRRARLLFHGIKNVCVFISSKLECYKLIAFPEFFSQLSYRILRKISIVQQQLLFAYCLSSSF